MMTVPKYDCRIACVVGVLFLSVVVSLPEPIHGQPELSTLSEEIYYSALVHDTCKSSQFLERNALGSWARTTLAHCKQFTDNYEAATCFFLEGLDYLAANNTGIALRSFEDALEEYESQGDFWGSWVVHFAILASVETSADYSLAVSHLRTGLEVLKKLETSEQEIPIRSLYLFGELWDFPNDLSINSIPEPLKQQLVKLATTATHHMLGVVLGCQERFEEAETHIQLSLEIVRNEPRLNHEDLLTKHLHWLQQQRALRDAKRMQSHRALENRAHGPTHSSSGMIYDMNPISMTLDFCNDMPLATFDTTAWRAALAECGKSADHYKQVACAALRGVDLLAAGDQDGALEALSGALADYQQLQDRWGVWTLHLLIANFIDFNDDGVSAVKHLQSALDWLSIPEGSQQSNAGRSLRLFGEILGSPGQYLNLLESLPQIEPAGEGMTQLATTLTNLLLGTRLTCLRRLNEAESYLQQALADLHSPWNSVFKSLVYATIGWLHQQRGRIDSAVALNQQALEAARFNGNALLAIAVAQRLSEIHALAGQLKEALYVNQIAVEIAGSDPFRQTWLRFERSVLFTRAGLSNNAEHEITLARTAADESGIAFLEEEMLLRNGIRLFTLGFLERSAGQLEKVAEMLHERPANEIALDIMGRTFFFLAQAYEGLGLSDLQEDTRIRLAIIADTYGNDEILRDLNLIFAIRAFQKTQTSDLEVDIDRFLDLFRQLLNAIEDSDVREDLTAMMLDLEEFEEVRSLGVDEEIFEAIIEMSKGSGIGKFFEPLVPIFDLIRQERYDESSRLAVEIFENFRARFKPPRLDEAKRLTEIAFIEAFGRDDFTSAAAKCKEAVRIFESLVLEMNVDETISGLFDEGGHEIYRRAVDILARVDSEEALFYAEKGRAWTLRRLLGGFHPNPPDTGSRQQEILARISVLEREWRKGRKGSGAARPHELERLRKEYETLRVRSQLKAAHGASVSPIKPATPSEIRQRALDANSTLLVYFAGQEHLFVWAIDRDGSEFVSVDMPKEKSQELACQIQDLRYRGIPAGARRLGEIRGVRLISNCEIKRDPAVELYRKLIAPLASHLRRRNLIVVPHGLLHHLPFSALQNPKTGRYLVQDFTISMAPSASALLQISERTRSDNREVLVMGGSVTPLNLLPGATQEVEAVADLVNSVAYLGEDATETRIYEHAGRLRLLHLAAHGVYVPSHPYFNRMLLAEDRENDGALEMHEVLDWMDLTGTDLVVLSGCDTALGEITRGDEVIGLPRAFLAAGSRTVISTLWPVADAASANLMKAFYSRLISEGAPAGEALRGAQLEMLAHEDTAAPYFWAGYTLIGDLQTRFSP